jgi:hypothetical protein
MRIHNSSKLMSKILLNEKLFIEKLSEKDNLPDVIWKGQAQRLTLKNELNEFLQILAECYTKINSKKKVFCFTIMSRV